MEVKSVENLSSMGEKPVILYINGVSSAGKSSACRYLMSLLRQPAIYLSLDQFHNALCDTYATDDWKLYNKECYGLHRTAKVWHSLGLNVVIDNVLETEKLAQDAVTVLPDAVFVGFHASLETLLAREKLRQRHHYKLVRYQFERVHQHVAYALEIDTEKSSAEQIAEQLYQFIQPLGAC